MKQVKQVSQAQQAKSAQAEQGKRGRHVRARRRLADLVGGARAHRRWVWLGAGVAVAVTGAAVAGSLLASDDKPGPPDARARQYRNIDACLLTGPQGVAEGTLGASVWAGMQDASSATHARVNFVPVTGEQTQANATPFVNGLVQRSCDVVVAAGKAPVAAAAAAAKGHPKVRFVLVDGQANGGNVTAVESGDGLRADVARAVNRGVNTAV
ncbi:BMP family ABC transporter substrate-binding protein [Streptomyces melanogenes]|uniref:BMP family ABC transporter substrate-binding protein n=1 Tax=Streptomyces melanogenes TaxID=67326 RepID=UPI001E2B007D|nr:BMP family ABC transporter substrate-binding protein [Streptomyces melanogenes]